MALNGPSHPHPHNGWGITRGPTCPGLSLVCLVSGRVHRGVGRCTRVHFRAWFRGLWLPTLYLPLCLRCRQNVDLRLSPPLVERVVICKNEASIEEDMLNGRTGSGFVDGKSNFGVAGASQHYMKRILLVIVGAETLFLHCYTNRHTELCGGPRHFELENGDKGRRFCSDVAAVVVPSLDLAYTKHFIDGRRIWHLKGKGTVCYTNRHGSGKECGERPFPLCVNTTDSRHRLRDNGLKGRTLDIWHVNCA